jgi:hypothetical protein
MMFLLSDMRQYWPKGIGVEKYMYIDSLALKGLEEGGLSSDPSQDAQNTHRHTIELPSEKDHPSLTAPASASLIAHSTGICQPRSPRLRHQHIAIITNPSEPRNPTPVNQSVSTEANRSLTFYTFRPILLHI